MGWLDDIFAQFLTAQDEAISKPARAIWNFGQGIKVTDNPGSSRLDIEVPTTSSTEAGLLPLTTGADKVLAAPANVPTWAKLVNANVDAAAAVAGTKIAPDFGAQNITTTGKWILAAGSAAAPTLYVSGSATTGLFAPVANTIGVSVSAAEQFRVGAGLLTWEKGIAAPTFNQATQTTDVVPPPLTIAPSAPFATATGANRVPGSLVVNLALPTNGGTTEGFFEVQRNAVTQAQIGYTATNWYTGGAATALKIPTNADLSVELGGTGRFFVDSNNAAMAWRCNALLLYTSTNTLGLTLTPSTSPTVAFDGNSDITLTGNTTGIDANTVLPTTTQTVVANAQGSLNTQQGLVRRYLGFIRTTGAVSTTAITIPLATSATGCYVVAKITGRCQATTGAPVVGDMRVLTAGFCFKNVAGVVTAGDGTPVSYSLSAYDTTMSAAGFDVIVSGTNLLVQPLGVADGTVDWTVEAEVTIT